MFDYKPIPHNPGIVYDLQFYYEIDEQVWHFRYSELANNPDEQPQMPLIAMELKGKKFDGFITNGDIIRVSKAKWSDGGTLEVDELINETTNSTMKKRF
jgi:hypothetical protein